MSPPVRRLMTGCVSLALVLTVTGRSAADILDLTTEGAHGDINGALLQQDSIQSSGTGVFSTFLRVQNSPTEQGYNTDARPTQFDEKTDPHTHSLLLNSLATINVNGTLYKQFLLDVNQENSGSGHSNALLSLDKLQIFLGPRGDLNNYPNLGTKIYDLGNNSITLDARLSHGSGSSDMVAAIPASLFKGPNPYVYLFCRFGDYYASNGGFEEWAATQSILAPTPEPASAVLFGLGLAGCGAYGWRRRRTITATR
jgi:PEP-CTERM motif